MVLRSNRIYEGQGAAPINQVAVRMFGKGETYEPAVKPGQKHWKAPPKTCRILPLNVPDLVGQRFGRFTVIGWWGKTSTWIVRCTCGDYENRRTTTLQKRSDPDACCFYCEHLKTIQKREKMPRNRVR